MYMDYVVWWLMVTLFLWFDILVMIMLVSLMLMNFVLCWLTLMLCSYDVMIAMIFSAFVLTHSCLHSHRI